MEHTRFFTKILPNSVTHTCECGEVFERLDRLIKHQEEKNGVPKTDSDKDGQSGIPFI